MKYISLFFLLAALLSVCACGKMSDPVPLENSAYPHSYPRY